MNGAEMREDRILEVLVAIAVDTSLSSEPFQTRTI